MIEIVEKKGIPVYETECWECKSKFRYTLSEVYLFHIECPVCGISNNVVPTEGSEVTYLEENE